MKTSLLSLLAVAIGVLLLACGGPSEYDVVGTDVAPSADGKVEVEEIDNHNNMVTVFIEHLLPPERLGEEITEYVMWIHPVNGEPQRATILDYDEDDRIATGIATTAESCFDVVITAETGIDPSAPSNHEVAHQRHCPGD